MKTIGKKEVTGVATAADPVASTDLVNLGYLTNRLKPRVGTVASNANPSINTDNVDVFTVTALATNIASLTTNLSGTPTVGQKLLLRFKDNGTARTITHGASFTSSGAATLLTTTVIGKTHHELVVWDGSVWVCLAVDTAGY